MARSSARRAQIPDRELIDATLRGDHDAFTLLYERYFQRVFGFVSRRLSNHGDTEETVQEVFVNIYSSLGSYRGDAPFAAWVFGLTRRILASRFKRRRPPVVSLGEEELHVDELLGPTMYRDPSPLEMVEYYECLEQLERAASCDLNEEQKTLFQLHHLEHQSIQAIARHMHKSVDAIKSNLYRTRKLLFAR